MPLAPLFIAAGLIVLFAGCSWFEPKKNTQGILNAEVSPYFGPRTPVRVQAYSRDKRGNREIITTHEVLDDGTVSFLVPAKSRDRYGLLAYADTNRNARLDIGEPRASAEDVVPTPLQEVDAPFAPVSLRLPGKGVARRPAASQAKREPSPRILSPEDEARLNELRRHLPDNFRLPTSLPTLPVR